MKESVLFDFCVIHRIHISVNSMYHDRLSPFYKWAASRQNQQNDCAPIEDSDAQADLSLRWVQRHFVGFVIIIIISLFQEDGIFGTNASLTYGRRLQR